MREFLPDTTLDYFDYKLFRYNIQISLDEVDENETNRSIFDVNESGAAEFIGNIDYDNRLNYLKIYP